MSDARLRELEREATDGSPAAVAALAYGMHVSSDFAVGSRCGPGVIACSGVAAAWCPVHGDCVCPSDDAGNRLDLTDPDCPLHAPASHHAASVSEADDPNRPGAR